MFDYLERMLSLRGLPPHGYCLLWDPQLVWTHVVADLLIGLAYFSIPVALGVFLTRRRDVQFGWVVWMFAAFIMACGATHFFSILTLWQPAYGIEGLLKLFTALVSVGTAIALWPLLPHALALPSPAQLQLANQQLEARIAERDEALSALRLEAAERSRVEEMLRQAQKMEVVGQLTGGFAHDYNNMLTIVVANLERAKRLAQADEGLQKPLDHAMQGADRAARLTHQLLAFSRRQPLQPTQEDLSRLVGGMTEMLATTMGPDIRIEMDLADPLDRVLVDRSQAENAILNLAINARDAMPEGGLFRLATRQSDGTVLLAVSDTGHGMAPEVLEHVFEPFFTTKGVGQGSGLGLSQVYGFTKQSGGEIIIESEKGEGTNVLISLPSAGAAAAVADD